MRSSGASSSSSSSLHSLSSGAMSPLSTASITLTALLILSIPVCTEKKSYYKSNFNLWLYDEPEINNAIIKPSCAPAELQQTTTEQRQLRSQIDAVCLSYLSVDQRFWGSKASDVLGELCVLMLAQKSQELKVRENSKRAELQGPGGIQSRGYFLYRPRNGRRSLEYE